MRVVVLGGADNQLACINAARRVGAEVIVVDPRPDVPGIGLADAWIGLDVAATEEVAELTLVRDCDAVLTDQSDYAARAAASLASALGLKGQDLSLIDACSNKLTMRQRMADLAPDLVPWFQHFTDPQAATRFAAAQEGPVIAKPLQSQGSRGVGRISSHADLPFIDAAFAESGGRGILVEQAVEGREYSVDGFVREGALTPLAIAAKTHYSGNPCLDERCDFLPSQFAPVEGPLLKAMDRIVSALGIGTGIVHAELIVDAGRATLVEIALRGGGAGISSVIVPFLTGFDPAEALLRHLLDLAPLAEPDDFRSRASTLRFLPAGPAPRQDAKRDLEVEGWLSLVLSDATQPSGLAPRSSTDRPGSIIVGAESEDAVRLVEAEAMRRLGYPAGA